MNKLLSIITVLCMVWLNGCSQKNPMLQSLSYEEARKSYFEGDHERAHRICELLAHQGDPRAQYALGYLYFYGIGTPVNKPLGTAWIKRSAENRFEKGIKSLELLKIPKDET